MHRLHLRALEEEFQKTKSMADRALPQLADEELHFQLSPVQNSVAAILQHVAGNLASRFTDFRTSDGEKPWRDREAEFADRRLPRPDLMALWAAGWNTLFNALAPLTDEDLSRVVTIRNEPTPSSRPSSASPPTTPGTPPRSPSSPNTSASTTGSTSPSPRADRPRLTRKWASSPNNSPPP